MNKNSNDELWENNYHPLRELLVKKGYIGKIPAFHNTINSTKIELHIRVENVVDFDNNHFDKCVAEIRAMEHRVHISSLDEVIVVLQITSVGVVATYGHFTSTRWRKLRNL